ncbi:MULTISPECIES: hypothetical protein [unclassified Pseudomonas]|uniref:hypothetical protein n=1 Tax=unclassified Pseudomonas TaxID=196821 RepID=UPI0021C955E7|nr:MULTISPECIES: hypothetical protein [unclassified Pseudomonas]MCU1735104.1 hypothetical protein [Pseudomonas sp. 20P_3.2_Bac4]MCU1743579.1 hypothetical protein [Pseudomonas sp. 20P_3.2_Bac5]
MVITYVEPLPSRRVIEEGRTYLRAAELIKTEAFNGDLALAWPAAMSTGLALELFLKAFHVKFDPTSPTDEYDPAFDPEGYLLLSKAARKDSHDLLALYQAIPSDLGDRLREISERLKPGYSLEASIKDCSQLFVGARYTYEAKSLQRFYSEVFELGPHLDQVLEEMIQEPVRSVM